MVDNNCIIEGNVKFRDGKKWKSRWCVMRKLSPVADCLHLQLYGDSRDRYKQGQTKASLSLQHFLGVESGFTLDKESNTIAIICQDVTVVLAFDTRERLIQWQVKISSNLVEDQEFLVLISTVPSKAKFSNGPAHLHIQDHRFCITVGMPPRLVGIWEIGHLRRYGVVDGRFCFEGGSRCGRGEGLHVLITDQGDDIVKTIQLATEGKLSTRKRSSINIGSCHDQSHDSPRRQFSRSETRVSDFFPSTTLYSSTTSYDDHCDSCKNDTTTYWSSTESRQQNDLDTDYRDTVSVSELTEHPGDWRSTSTLTRNIGINNASNGLERCSSCIGKLGTVSKSSTGFTNSTASGGSVGVINNLMSSCHMPQHPRSNITATATAAAFDRLSLSSYSSSSHDSDYSASPHQIDCRCNAQIQTKDQRIISSSSSSSSTSSSACPVITLPPRPPKPSAIVKKKKPPMPLPAEQSAACACIRKQVHNNPIGPYENYDVPKSIMSGSSSSSKLHHQDQYYDTPRKIKECLAIQKNIYPNYDIPQAVLQQQCGCPMKLSNSTAMATTSVTRSSSNSLTCPCHNVMSWAGFVLPYCRRGAGIEPTGVTVHPVRLSGEGKMPVVNANGELAIYPSRVKHEKCVTERQSAGNSSNYENVVPVINTQPESEQTNYVNIDFTQSLGHYENSKDLLSKSGITQSDIEEFHQQLKQRDKDEEGRQKEAEEEEITGEEKEAKICQKCGHVKEDDYLVMDPEKQQNKIPFPGYLPMQPAHKEMLSRMSITNVKSSSNPALSSDSDKKRDNENRLPGSAMLSSPYLRRRLMDSSNAESNVGILLRKRSYSAESAHYLDENNTTFSSNLTIHKCSSEADKSCLVVNDANEQDKNIEVNASPQPSAASIKIRRSSSVPSKAGHNRDSSSSNDSGVSTGSLSHRTGEFVEFELSSQSNAMNPKKTCPQNSSCYHSSLPRKSKSSDPLRELSFQFQKSKIPTKSSSAEGDIPTCLPKNHHHHHHHTNSKNPNGGFSSPGEVSSTTPYIDSRSTSSGTSDMSDYIETLSLSSHSSSDTPDNLRFGGRAVATTLRPRSGKEYYKIDRSILVVDQNRIVPATGANNYANITPVLEKSESPSPGYISSSPFEQPQPTRDHFLFPEIHENEAVENTEKN